MPFHHPSSPFVSSSCQDHGVLGANVPMSSSNPSTMSPSSDNNILDLEIDMLERIGLLSANCHSSAALLYRWARHPQFPVLCDWLEGNQITGPYIAWLGQWACEPGSACSGDLFAVLNPDRVGFELIRAKLNAMADVHEAHNPTSHLHRIQ
jgi:hypothetical protein